jgi:hypothetical protein
MKFGYYLIYGQSKDLGPTEDVSNAFEKFEEVLKKYKMELTFWGFPFGTTENLMYVLKGSVEDYQSLFGNPDFAEANPIGSGQRTNMVLVP